MNSIDKSRYAALLCREMDRVDSKIRFMDEMEEWTDNDGRLYDELVAERESLQQEYNQISRG